MHRTTGLVALAATFSSAMAAFQGFNYGSTFTTGAVKAESDFEAEFKAAQALAGTNGAFNSARLYTTVQGGTSNTPISAIPAAIKTKTSLLLGLWASAGEAVFANELQALKSAIDQYGSDFTSLVAGISVGSEDLYRISPTGILNKENPGAEPSTIADYIKQVREAIAGTSLKGAAIGHVDTWTVWVNGSNQAVIDACDWIGVDAYPYFQDTMANSIENNKGLFFDAFDATKAAAGGKPVWVTETGYPVSGKTAGQAVASPENAETYWDEVGCPLFGETNVWWYTLQDAAPDTPNPSFGVLGNSLTSAPLYDLSCDAADQSSTKSSTSPTSTGSTSPPSSSALGGGSPGAGDGIASSQISLETSTLTGTASNPTGTGAGSTGGSGSGSGSGSGGAHGSGSVSNSTANPTGSSPTPTASPSTTLPNGAGIISGSISAAFAAVMAAALAL